MYKRQTVYHKPTHSGLYIKKDSNHPDYVKHGAIRTLHACTTNICSGDKYLRNDINITVDDFSHNGYCKHFVYQTINNNILIKIVKWKVVPYSYSHTHSQGGMTGSHTVY